MEKNEENDNFLGWFFVINQFLKNYSHFKTKYLA